MAKRKGSIKERRADQALKAVALAFLAIVAILLAQTLARAEEAAGDSAELAGSAAPSGAPAGASPLPADLLPRDLEILRRIEGRIQRSVLDRLLGAGKGRVLVERLAPEASDGMARKLGLEAGPVLPRLAVTVTLAEEFSQERLDLVRREILEAVGANGFAADKVEILQPDPVLAALEDARRAVYEGRLEDALILSVGAVKARPDDPRALELAGSVYFLLGDRVKAKALWKRALELDPANRTVAEFLDRMS